ncbi:MAG: DMT family transporter [Deferribacteraceae bacterium]|jgi:drug/metabolite transporter (DMT)-like permease|nr:DMT family transporter [Deferribacteraceae bacterium]
MTKTENNILLFSVTLCWSASYIFIKSLPPDFSPYAYLTMTAGIAAVILSIVFWRQLKQIKSSTVWRSFILSIFLTIDMLLEKKGIELIPASNASFLSALTIMIVPLIMLLFSVKPSRNNIIGACIIVFGLGFSTRFSPSGFLSLGTFYMLSASFFYSLYIIAADRFTKEENPLLICVVQMIFAALLGYIIWSIEEPRTFFSVNYTHELLSSVFILAFFMKAYAYIVLMFSQRYADPIRVTIIASTEPVIALLLAVTVPAVYSGGERLTAFSLCGSLFIAVGAVIAGTNFLEKNKETANAY